MNDEDRKLLEDDGWTIDCESPFEISDKDGSSAQGRAANYVLDYLKNVEPFFWCAECGREEVKEQGARCSECQGLKLDENDQTKPWSKNVCAECGKPATNTLGTHCQEHAHMVY
jgi:hypothetical protein